MAAAQQVTELSISTTAITVMETYTKVVKNANEAVDKLTTAQVRRRDAEEKATQATQRMTTSTTEFVAAASAYATATTQAEQAVDKFNAAQDRRQQADNSVARSTNQAAAQLNLYIRSLDPLLAVSQQWTMHQGLLVGALATTIAKLSESASSINAFVQASGQLVARYEELAAAGEKTSGIDSLNAALEKIADRAIEDAFKIEGLGTALAGIGAGSTSALIGLGLLAGAAVATVAAVEQVAKNQREFDLALRASGGAVGLTVAQLEQLAVKTAGYGGVTVQSARDIETTLARTGEIGGSVFTGLTAATADYAAISGKNLKDAATDLAAAFSSPAEGARQLDRELNFLSDQQKKSIADMDAQGNKLGAQTQLLDALRDHAKGAAEDGLGPLARVFNLISTAIDQTSNGITKFLALGAGEQGKRGSAEIEDDIAKLPKVSPNPRSSLSRQLDKLQTELWNERAAETLALFDAQAAADNNVKRKIDTIDRWLDPKKNQLEDVRNKKITIEYAIEENIGDKDKNENILKSLEKREQDLLSKRAAATTLPAPPQADIDRLTSYRKAVEDSKTAFSDAEKAARPYQQQMAELEDLMKKGQLGTEQYAEAEKLLPQLEMRRTLAVEEAQKALDKLGNATLARIDDVQAETAATLLGEDALKALRRERELNADVMRFEAELQDRVNRGYDLQGKSVGQVTAEYRNARAAQLDVARTRAEADKAAAEVRKKADDLSGDIAEAIYDAGAKGGKGFWEKFQEWGRATIKRLAIDLVLKPIIQPVMMSVVGALPQLFGLSGSGGASSAPGQAGTSWLSKLMPGPSDFLPKGFLNPFDSKNFMNFSGLFGSATPTYSFTAPISGITSATAAEAIAGGGYSAISGATSATAAEAMMSGVAGTGVSSTTGAGASMFGAAGAAGPLAVVAAAIIALYMSGALENQQKPRGNAQFGALEKGRFTPGLVTGLDGYDTTAITAERDNALNVVNGLIDGLSLKFNETDYEKSFHQFGGLGGIGPQFGFALTGEEWLKRLFAWNTNAGRAAGGQSDLSQGVYQLEAGIGTRTSGSSDEGWRTTYIDEKTGDEIAQEDFDQRYTAWKAQKEGAFGTPGSLFSTDNTTLQALLNRMSMGQYTAANAKELGEALGFASNWDKAEDVARYGADSKEVQEAGWAEAAKAEGSTLLTSVKKFMDDALKYFGTGSTQANEAGILQRQTIFQSMGLNPEGAGAIGEPTKLTGADAAIAEVKTRYNEFQKALEATGMRAADATAAINRGIAARTEEIRAIDDEQKKRMAFGFSSRENAALVALGRGAPQTMHFGGTGPVDSLLSLLETNADTIARDALAEQHRQELYEAEAASMSKVNIERMKLIQSLEVEALKRQQIEGDRRTVAGFKAREDAAYITLGWRRGDTGDSTGTDAYTTARNEVAERHRQELYDAEAAGMSKVNIERLKAIQSLEAEAQVRRQQIAIADRGAGLRQREVEAQLAMRQPGVRQDDVEQYALGVQQWRELMQAQTEGWSQAEIEGLKYVQGLEMQALVLQQAERARQKEEAYLLRTAQALVGLLAGSSAQQQGQYLVEDIQRQIAQSQELRNATSEADRARILEIQHLEDASIAVQRAAAAQQQYNDALKTAKDQIEGFRTSVNQWLDQQKVNQVGGPTAMASYLAAQQQYNEQLDKVRAGDTTAMGSITGYADRLIAAMQALDQPNAVANLDASRNAFEALVGRARAGDTEAMSQVLAQADQYRQIGLNAYGSTEAYQSLLAQIQLTMKQLPDQIKPEDMARKAIEKLNEDLVPPTKEQLEVIKSLERLSAATKSALGYSGFSLSDQQTAIQILQQNQVFEAKEGNRLAGLILEELKKTPTPSTPTTPTTPVPTGPSPMDAYTSLMSLAGTVSVDADRLRGMGLSQAEIDAQIESQYGSYRNSLLDIMAAQPALIQQFGQSYWRNNYTAGPAYARQLLSNRGIVPAFEYGGLALSLGGPGSAFPAILHHGERVLTNEQDAIFTRLSDAMLQQPRWSMPAAQRPANDHVVTREVLAEMREQKEQGEQVVSLLAQLVARLGGDDADDATLDDVVDAINRLQPALRGGQALAGARPISKAG